MQQLSVGLLVITQNTLNSSIALILLESPSSPLSQSPEYLALLLKPL